MAHEEQETSQPGDKLAQKIILATSEDASRLAGQVMNETLRSARMTDDRTDKIAAALAAAQAEMPTIPKSKRANAGSYSYAYADLADVIKVTAPVLGRHGLAVTQEFELTESGKEDPDEVGLRTRLLHESGQSLVSFLIVGPITLPPQQMGAAMTYMRRYALCALIGVAADEDTDAQGTGPVHKTPRRRESNVKKKTVTEAMTPPADPDEKKRDQLAKLANGKDSPKAVVVSEIKEWSGLEEADALKDAVRAAGVAAGIDKIPTDKDGRLTLSNLKWSVILQWCQKKREQGIDFFDAVKAD